MLLSKGKEAYKPPATPTKIGANKSTTPKPSHNNSINNNNNNNNNNKSSASSKQNSIDGGTNLRNDYGLQYDMEKVVFEDEEDRLRDFEEDDDDDDDEDEDNNVVGDDDDERKKDGGGGDDDEHSELSWRKKSGSDEDNSDSFAKPVDFGIDKETSIKLDKLNLMLMVGKDPHAVAAVAAAGHRSIGGGGGVESANTSARLDSPTRQHVSGVLAANKERTAANANDASATATATAPASPQLRNSYPQAADSKSLTDGRNKELKALEQSVEREFNQKRLDLLESKEKRLTTLKDDMEREIRSHEDTERKRLLREQETKLK